MKFLTTLAITTALAASLMASTAYAAPLKFALVAKALGNGFFDAANKGAQEPPRSWATST
jgi:rhamnose transport system substrate-binding protein